MDFILDAYVHDKTVPIHDSFGKKCLVLIDTCYIIYNSAAVAIVISKCNTNDVQFKNGLLKNALK